MADISYRILRSDRKTISLEITRDGEVVVRAPRRMATARIEQFVTDKSAWLQKHLAARAARDAAPVFSHEEIEQFTERAAEIIPPRVAFFAQKIGVTYNRISIRHQRTRWGSCSSKGNLNFNCLLVLTPPEVMDYIIVHELCHRKELNHSVRFRTEVARVMPDYKRHEQWLKATGGALIRRLP